MEQFPGNSQNILGETKQPKPEKPKKDIQKVVSGEVVQRKKPIGRKFKELFFGGSVKGVFKFIGSDVLLPALKNLFVDTVEQGAKRAVYGESASRRRPDLGRPRFSYNSPVERFPQQRRAMLPDQPPYSPRRRQDVGEIILVTRDEAEIVLERLTDIIDKYEVASIADLHDLVGLPTTYVDNKWGWSSLRGVDIRQIREGFLLDLPQVEPI